MVDYQQPLESYSTAKGLRRLGDDRDIEVMSFELEKEDVMKHCMASYSSKGFLTH